MSVLFYVFSYLYIFLICVVTYHSLFKRIRLSIMYTFVCKEIKSKGILVYYNKPPKRKAYMNDECRIFLFSISAGDGWPNVAGGGLHRRGVRLDHRLHDPGRTSLLHQRLVPTTASHILTLAALSLILLVTSYYTSSIHMFISTESDNSIGYYRSIVKYKNVEKLFNCTVKNIC